jgi:AcrR family transcriptional regulator
MRDRRAIAHDRTGRQSMARAARAEVSGDAQERILVAALATFSERGFDGARTREIAARADVTLGLLQYYFGGKAKLWEAAVDLAFAELSSGLEAVIADPRGASDARERLRLVIRAHTHFVGRNPEFVRIMHDEGKRRGPRMRWLVDRHVKSLFEAMTALVEDAQAQGVLPSGIAAFHFVYILIGAVGMIFNQAEECKRVVGIDPTEPPAIDAHARAIEELFLGAPPEELSG